jgi:apolipoprotein D and lipocalin family protein
MKRCVSSFALAAAILMLGCQTTQPPLAVVENVDLDRYLGRWYEIASFPQRFQKGCTATAANYSKLENGRIRVVNECRNETLDGELRQVEGEAWVVDPAKTLAKLRVQFFWPFSGAYWIIDLDPQYRWAVVGHPSREYLWVLSRSRRMDDAVYTALIDRIVAKGYDSDRLQRTAQPADI